MIFRSHFPYYTIESKSDEVAAITSFLLSNGLSKLESESAFVVPEFNHPNDFLDWYDQNYGNIVLSLQNNLDEVRECLGTFKPGWEGDDDYDSLEDEKDKVFHNHCDCLYAWINKVQFTNNLKNFIIDIGESWV